MSKFFTVQESINILKNQIAYHELEKDAPKPKLIAVLKDNIDGFNKMLELHQKIEMVRDEADKLVNDIEKQVIENFEETKLSEKLKDFRLMNIIVARNLISTMTEDQYVTLSDLDLPLVKTSASLH